MEEIQKETRQEICRRYYQNNRDEILRKKNAYRKAFPEKAREYKERLRTSFVECCGRPYCKMGIYKHIQTKKHLAKLGEGLEIKSLESV